jgi:hypothetical protein
VELTPLVKDSTEAIQALPNFAEAITSLVKTPGGIVLALLLFLWLVVNSDYSRMLEMLEYKKRRRLEQINEYVASPDLADPETITAVKDLRDTHYFKVATGIYAEGVTRSGLIKAHQILSHSVTWTHIRRAHPYIYVAADQSITIRELTIFEKFGYWYNQFVAYACMGFAALWGAMVIITGNKSASSFLLGFGGAGLVVLFAMFVFYQNWPVHAKDRIAKELRRVGGAPPDV